MLQALNYAGSKYVFHTYKRLCGLTYFAYFVLINPL